MTKILRNCLEKNSAKNFSDKMSLKCSKIRFTYQEKLLTETSYIKKIKNSAKYPDIV